MNRKFSSIAIPMAVLVIAALVGGAIFFFARPDPIATAFNRLTVGMAEPEVERLFGRPCDGTLEIPGGRPMLVWFGSGGIAAYISFDEQSTLATKILTTGSGARF